MVMFCELYAIIFAVIAATFANSDINVDCGLGTIQITWRVLPELVPSAAHLFLGNCHPSQISVLPTGEGEATFNYNLNDCKFQRVIMDDRLVYKNELTYRPFGEPKPAAFTYPIECVYNRSGRVPPSSNPAYGSADGHGEGQGELVFHMGLLNENLTALAESNVIPLGSFIPIWAAVEQKAHQPLLLLMEECVAADTPELQPKTQVYPIITNLGCLVDGKLGNSRFLSRYHSSAILLYLQSFQFALGEEVYIHCKLVAWDPEVLDEGRKACNYIKDRGGWELLDNPLQSELCSCCDSKCKSRVKRGVKSGPGSKFCNWATDNCEELILNYATCSIVTSEPTKKSWKWFLLHQD